MRHQSLLPILTLGLAIIAPSTVSSQTPSGATASTATNQPVTVAYRDVPSSATGAMTLDVVVTDKSGAPLEGLSAADFKLLDNKTPQNILSVRAAEGFAAKPDPPVEVIVVLDAINSSFLTETNARKWIRDFLDENGGQLALPTSLLVLTDHGAKAQDHPSRDGKVLEQFLDANNPGLRTMKKDQGWEGAMAREQASLKLLNLLATGEARVPGRKLLLWLSPGWQMISQSMSSRSQKSNNLLFDYIVSISTELRAARITLYNINPQEAGPGQYQFESYLKPVDVPEHSDFGNLLLPVLAEETGGQVMAGYNDLAKLMDRCIADAKDYYELTFTPPRPVTPTSCTSSRCWSINLDRRRRLGRARSTMPSQRLLRVRGRQQALPVKHRNPQAIRSSQHGTAQQQKGPIRIIAKWPFLMDFPDAVVTWQPPAAAC